MGVSPIVVSFHLGYIIFHFHEYMGERVNGAWRTKCQWIIRTAILYIDGKLIIWEKKRLMGRWITWFWVWFMVYYLRVTFLQLRVSWLFWFRWFGFLGSPKMKRIAILRGTPIRVPNHQPKLPSVEFISFVDRFFLRRWRIFWIPGSSR